MRSHYRPSSIVLYIRILNFLNTYLFFSTTWIKAIRKLYPALFPTLFLHCALVSCNYLHQTAFKSTITIFNQYESMETIIKFFINKSTKINRMSSKNQQFFIKTALKIIFVIFDLYKSMQTLIKFVFHK